MREAADPASNDHVLRVVLRVARGSQGLKKKVAGGGLTVGAAPDNPRVIEPAAMTFYISAAGQSSIADVNIHLYPPVAGMSSKTADSKKGPKPSAPVASDAKASVPGANEPQRSEPDVRVKSKKSHVSDVETESGKVDVDASDGSVVKNIRTGRSAIPTPPVKESRWVTWRTLFVAPVAVGIVVGVVLWLLGLWKPTEDKPKPPASSAPSAAPSAAP